MSAYSSSSDPTMELREGTPIGLLLAAKNGTNTAQWTHAGGSSGDGVFYDAMIKPLQPYAIRGVIWYVGTAYYTDTAPDRINDVLLLRLGDEWQSDWGQGEFPFHIWETAQISGAAN
jgi:hypothetical protein